MRGWGDAWVEALKRCYGSTWKRYALRVPPGLAELLSDGAAFREAHESTVVGLLAGKQVHQNALRAVAEQLEAVVIGPFFKRVRGET